LFCLGLLFKHSPTRREDFTKVWAYPEVCIQAL
jgi:hypothetical protein